MSGAGKNLAAARKPAMLEAGGQTVAILAYDAIAGYYHATADKIGSAPLTASIVRADIRAARAAGADLVIVFPHWGTEYRSKPFAAQQDLARMIIDSGADMVIGNHAHWAAAMEVYKGKPIWYALGNFVFDQTWSEPTMEGITLELTFSGTGPRPGPDAAAHHPGPVAAQLPGPGRRRQGRARPGLLGVEGVAALVRGGRAEADERGTALAAPPVVGPVTGRPEWRNVHGWTAKADGRPAGVLAMACSRSIRAPQPRR